MFSTLNLPYDSVGVNLIEEGDVLLFRGGSFVSRVIQKLGGGLYSHCALASWNGPSKNILECIEFREWKGSRTTALRQQVAEFDGLIDVFRPDRKCFNYKVKIERDGKITISEEEKIFNGQLITDDFRRLTGLPYGWTRIFAIAMRKLSFFRIYSSDIDIDDLGVDLAMVCSTSIAYLFRKHFVDLVRFKPDTVTEPSDLSRSPVLNYLFTLKKDW